MKFFNCNQLNLKDKNLKNFKLSKSSDDSSEAIKSKQNLEKKTNKILTYYLTTLDQIVEWNKIRKRNKRETKRWMMQSNDGYIYELHHCTDLIVDEMSLSVIRTVVLILKMMVAFLYKDANRR